MVYDNSQLMTELALIEFEQRSIGPRLVVGCRMIGRIVPNVMYDIRQANLLVSG